MGAIILKIRRVCTHLLVLLIPVIILGESAHLRSIAGLYTASPARECSIIPSFSETIAVAGEPRGKTEPRSPSLICPVIPRLAGHPTNGELILAVQRHVLETFTPIGLILLKSVSTSSSL